MIYKIVTKHVQVVKYKHVWLQGEIHAKDHQIERYENTTNILRQRYFDHAKNT